MFSLKNLTSIATSIGLTASVLNTTSCARDPKSAEKLLEDAGYGPKVFPVQTDRTDVRENPLKDCSLPKR